VGNTIEYLYKVKQYSKRLLIMDQGTVRIFLFEKNKKPANIITLMPNLARTVIKNNKIGIRSQGVGHTW
jgi:hypothetical protein